MKPAGKLLKRLGRARRLPLALALLASGVSRLRGARQPRLPPAKTSCPATCCLAHPPPPARRHCILAGNCRRQRGELASDAWRPTGASPASRRRREGESSRALRCTVLSERPRPRTHARHSLIRRPPSTLPAQNSPISALPSNRFYEAGELCWHQLEGPARELPLPTALACRTAQPPTHRCAASALQRWRCSATRSPPALALSHITTRQPTTATWVRWQALWLIC